MRIQTPPPEGRPIRRKCCEKCAFRHGSPERSDEWGWMRFVEGWQEDGSPFYCHTGVPGHEQEVADGAERWQLCAGWAVMRGATTGRYMHRTGLDVSPPDFDGDVFATTPRAEG